MIAINNGLLTKVKAVFAFAHQLDLARACVWLASGCQNILQENDSRAKNLSGFQ
jgi:hypothetical protein